MEIPNKYMNMLNANEEELAEIVGNWSEKEIKEFIDFLISWKNKDTKLEIEFISRTCPPQQQSTGADQTTK